MNRSEPLAPGRLQVVATPIGNLGDISQRMASALEEADLIAAEDTRSAARLLSHLGLKKKLVSYHDFNERTRAAQLLDAVRAGQRVVIVSEAGTPCISDPGYHVVRQARQEGLTVEPVPGPSALVTFLSASGLATDAFTFAGFPPAKAGKRKNFFARYADRPETLVFYESPRRVLDALADAIEVFGDREGCLGREMTKRYEEFLYGPLSTIRQGLEAQDAIRGEIVWGMAGAGSGEVADADRIEELVAAYAESDTPPRQAAKEIAARTGADAKEIYAQLVNARRS